MKFELQLTTEQQIKSYITDERKFRGINIGMDICYLNFDTETFKMMAIYFVLVDNNIAGFCLVPRYQPDILTRLYITPDYRRKGAGSFLLNALNITKLNCLVENDVGVLFYQSNDFTIDQKFDSSRHIHTFIRKLNV